MSIKVRIDSKGIKQSNGDSGFEVQAKPANTGFFPFKLYTQNVGTAFTASVPGFYFVSGSTQCTGTIPKASDHPGAMYMFSVTNNMPMRVTASARSLSHLPSFARNDISSSAGGPGQLATDRNDGINLAASGSVTLQSNGFVWQPVVVSGSLTLAPGGGIVGT